jgi:peptidyl-prolyl cis-trans isomerase D
MLDLFRASGLKSIVYGAVIVATVLAFVIGFPTMGKKTNSIREACVATVSGFCVDPKTHRAAYRMLAPQDSESPMAQRAKLNQAALDGLIERELLVGEAERLGLSVDDAEIEDSILGGYIWVSVPMAEGRMGQFFQLQSGHVYAGFKDSKTKQFDMKVYERSVRMLTGRSPLEFREWQRRELLAAKTRDLVRAPVRVSDAEGFQDYVEEKSTAQITYVPVKLSWVEKYALNATQAQIDEWGKDKANAASIKAPDVRHILIKAEASDAGADAKAQAKVRAEALIERLKKGEDFAKLAKSFSADPGSASNGGFYEADNVKSFVEPFKKAFEALKPGEFTQAPVETQFGWHIIKKEDPIRSAFMRARSTEIAKDLADKLAAAIKGGQTPEAAAKAIIAPFIKAQAAAPAEAPAPKPTGDGGADAGPAPAAPKPDTADTDLGRPDPVNSSPFNRGGDPIQGLDSSASAKLIDFAFSGKEGDVLPTALRTEEGFVVVLLKGKKLATREEFDKERETYMAVAMAKKQQEALSTYIKRLRDARKEDIKIDNSYLSTGKADGGAPAQGAPEEDEE